jgi:hypothetical protein
MTVFWWVFTLAAAAIVLLAISDELAGGMRP